MCLCQSTGKRDSAGNSPGSQQASFISQEAAWAEDKEKLDPFPFVLAPELEVFIKFLFAVLR